MSIAKAGETIFSSISDKTVAQVKKREEYTSNNSKSIENLSSLNQNTGWVKVSSGSNILAKKEGKTWSGPARRFILHGGAMMTKDQAKNREVDTVRKGINFDKGTSFSNSGNAYNNYSDSYGLGYRPMPGITSFNLKSYNPYGTLRQADITFTVFSLDDLHEAERLFLRPGFTCVMEFGHTVFTNNKGEQETFGKTINALDEKFVFSTQTIEDVEKEIERKRDLADGNYDGFFGYVSNFGYSFRPDGGFDCSMKVVSKGVILDSIKGGETSDGARVEENPKDQNKESTEDSSVSKHKSIFHTIFKSITEYVPNPDEPDSFTPKLVDVFGECKLNGENITLFAKLDTEDQCQFVYANVTDPVQGEGGNSNVKSTERLSYIPLRFVLDIFNKFASIYKVGDKNRNNPIISFALDFGNKFRTFKDHFSVIPSNVHLPKVAPTIENPYGKAKYGMSADNADTKMQDYAMSGNFAIEYAADGTPLPGDGKNEILNIFISTKVLLSLVDDVYDKANTSVTFIDFINGLLEIINTSLSDVCKLSLFYNEGINKYEIVDLYGIGKVKKIPTITLTGLKSTVKELSISSRLSANTAAQISIAAQGTVTNYNENVRAIRSWNLGAVDRFIPSKVTNTEPDVCTEDNSGEDPGKKTSLLTYGGNLTKFFGSNAEMSKQLFLFFIGIKDTKEFNAETEKDLQGALRKINLIMYEIVQAEKSDKGVTHEIPIPVELSFTMKGISGFKIGQVFKINEGVLLPRYDKYGYVITGLGNKVENNEWTTNVETQFFELDNL